MIERTAHPAKKQIAMLRKDGVVVDYAILQHDTGAHDLEDHRLAADMARRQR